jgi:hypothetical protein
MLKEEVEEKTLRWIDPREADLVFDCFTLTVESR